MELTIVAAAAVVAIVTVAAVSQRIAVAAPLSMVGVGIALSFLPGLAARSAGRYRSRTLTRAQRALDLMEATVQQIPDLADTEASSDSG